MNVIPSIKFTDSDGNPVASSSDPRWKYTVINGCVRIVRDGTPEHLVNGSWKPITSS